MMERVAAQVRLCDLRGVAWHSAIAGEIAWPGANMAPRKVLGSANTASSVVRQ